MFICSKKIMRFVREIKWIIKEVLFKEVGLRVVNDRFYDKLGWNSYPISVVIYNHKTMLGYFDAAFYELGFHERLMHVSKKQLYDVIRHEIAHYITFINCEEVKEPHGPEFRGFCAKMGWGEEVYRATLCLEEELVGSCVEELDVLRKIQKLLALTTSSNQHEAEQAMIKSQQLLLKHNIDSKYIEVDEEEKMVFKRILKQKKQDAKMRAIAIILETFFVDVVYNRATDGICLQILGSSVNVQIAEYVAEVLQGRLDDLWLKAKDEHDLKGLIAKNSFFLGVAKGYCNKINFLKKSYQPDVTNALVVMEEKLSEAKSLLYTRLSSSKSQAGYCSESSKLGEAAGSQLNINPALRGSSKNSGQLISCDN
ncbi:MAG: DUF2786 domain-containing protein [Verrucomicrobia bacterium]|nr:DUF2786 domain-containing protein [Verrucomicrobiota bacterium]